MRKKEKKRLMKAAKQVAELARVSVLEEPAVLSGQAIMLRALGFSRRQITSCIRREAG